MADDPIIFDGAFEIRARGDRRVLTGKFPYNKMATVKAGGRVRKERFAPESMSWQVREFQKVQQELADVIESSIEEARKQILIEQLEDAIEKRNTFLLVGHSYDRTIADMRSGTLAVNHKRDAVEIEAELPADEAMPSWVRDAVARSEGQAIARYQSGLSSCAWWREVDQRRPEHGRLDDP